MSLIQSVKMVLAPPHPAGRPFIYIGLGVAVIGGMALGNWLFWVGLLFTAFCLYFFRDPERFPPPRPGLLVAPADGTVVSVAPAVPPVELGLGDTPRWRVAIFLSVLNVHVNRSPAEGVVTRIAYRPIKGLRPNGELNGYIVCLVDRRRSALIREVVAAADALRPLSPCPLPAPGAAA